MSIDTFLKKLFNNSAHILKDDFFENIGISNEKLMFFCNVNIELLSYQSNYGTRIKPFSLIGIIKNEIEYYYDIFNINQSKDKDMTVSKERINYIISLIKTHPFLQEEIKSKYTKLINNIKDSPVDYINFLKMLYNYLINNHVYFNHISDTLYEELESKKNTYEDYDLINDLTNEYLSLCIDYGISVKGIRDIWKDIIRKCYESKKQGNLFKIFEIIGEKIDKNSEFTIIVKLEKKFDKKLVEALKLANNKQFQILSKKGLLNILNDVTNEKASERFKDKLQTDEANSSFIKYKTYSKDIWQAMNNFKYGCLQPYLGSLRYAGIYDKMIDEKYTVISHDKEKKFVKDYKHVETVFSPFSQSKEDYGDLFKRLIIKKKDNDISNLADEVISLLPAYESSTDSLSRFSSVWFALEAIYRNSSAQIKDALNRYASNLITDKYISGKLKLTITEFLMIRNKKDELGNNRIEGAYSKMFSEGIKNCVYLNWKIEKIKYIIANYNCLFDNIKKDVKYHLNTIYFLRNKQFHGSKQSSLENSTGYLFDIVCDSIEFMFDYQDVFKKDKITLSEMYSSILLIKDIKSALIDNEDNLHKKAAIICDSIRKL